MERERERECKLRDGWRENANFNTTEQPQKSQVARQPKKTIEFVFCSRFGYCSNTDKSLSIKFQSNLFCGCWRRSCSGSLRRRRRGRGGRLGGGRCGCGSGCRGCCRGRGGRR